MLILSWTNIIKKIKEDGWKIISINSLKIESVLQGTLHQDILLIFVYVFFFQTNLVFKFNIVPIE